MSTDTDLTRLTADLIDKISKQSAMLGTLTRRLDRVEQFVYGGVAKPAPVSATPAPVIKTPDPDKYWNAERAAQYLALPGPDGAAYLLRQVYRGRGPKAFRPSPNVTLFTQRDLDQWRANW